MDNTNEPISGGWRKKIIWGGAIFIAGVLLLTAGNFLFYSAKKFDRLSNWTDPDKYQAVFLSNGQVYFGRVTDVTSDTLLMENIYYLKTVQNLQQSQDNGAGDKTAAGNDGDLDGQNFSLIKLGNEIHGPEDNMSINLQQVLFVENLKPDSKVVQAIGEYEQRK